MLVVGVSSQEAVLAFVGLIWGLAATMLIMLKPQKQLKPLVSPASKSYAAPKRANAPDPPGESIAKH